MTSVAIMIYFFYVYNKYEHAFVINVLYARVSETKQTEKCNVFYTNIKVTENKQTKKQTTTKIKICRLRKLTKQIEITG